MVAQLSGRAGSQQRDRARHGSAALRQSQRNHGPPEPGERALVSQTLPPRRPWKLSTPDLSVKGSDKDRKDSCLLTHA